MAGHATFLNVPRETQMAKTLFAVDELSGFITAVAYVRPEGIHGMTPKSVKKKLKQPSFAAAVNRDEVYQAAEELGVDFDEHLTKVIAAMAKESDALGLNGSPARRSGARMSTGNVELGRTLIDAWNRRDARGDEAPYGERTLSGCPLVLRRSGRRRSIVATRRLRRPSKRYGTPGDRFEFQEAEVRDHVDSVIWLGRVRMQGKGSGVALAQELAFHLVLREAKIVVPKRS